LGKTDPFNDHEDAVKKYTGQGCSGQCVNEFAEAFKQADQKFGVTTVQFMSHADMKCGRTTAHPISSQGGNGKNGGIEIVDVKGSGKTGCASNFKAGWEASASCNCDSSIEYANCKGFGDPDR